VIGTAALWGRVVEHELGYRGELGYPQRLRLVCPECLWWPPSPGSSADVVAVLPRGLAVPLCNAHLVIANESGLAIRSLRSAHEIEIRLLSTYRVDLLPSRDLTSCELSGPRCPRARRPSVSDSLPPWRSSSRRTERERPAIASGRQEDRIEPQPWVIHRDILEGSHERADVGDGCARAIEVGIDRFDDDHPRLLALERATHAGQDLHLCALDVDLDSLETGREVDLTGRDESIERAYGYLGYEWPAPDDD
jgi:hypothetical protein